MCPAHHLIFFYHTTIHSKQNKTSVIPFHSSITLLKQQAHLSVLQPLTPLVRSLIKHKLNHLNQSPAYPSFASTYCLLTSAHILHSLYHLSNHCWIYFIPLLGYLLNMLSKLFHNYTHTRWRLPLFRGVLPTYHFPDLVLISNLSFEPKLNVAIYSVQSPTRKISQGSNLEVAYSGCARPVHFLSNTSLLCVIKELVVCCGYLFNHTE